MNSEWEECLSKCSNRIRDINNTYSSGEGLLQDTIKSAMLWVPQYIIGKYKPNADQLLDIGTKIVAIGIATELSNKKRSIGF